MAGKVALITGRPAARAGATPCGWPAEGADIIGVDLCADIDAIPYPLATPADLDETARLVAETGAPGGHGPGRRARPRRPGRRGRRRGWRELGRLDVAVANAGVCTVQRWDEVTPAVWDAVIGINLTGAWNTCVAAIPHLLEAGGGSLILISSVAGLKGQPFFAPYVASKHGMVGHHAHAGQRAGHRGVRVNSIHPTGVDTPMLVGLAGLTERIEASPGHRLDLPQLAARGRDRPR